MKKKLFKRLYREYPIEYRNILEQNIANKTAFDTEYHAISAWYLYLRRMTNYHPVFSNRFSFNIDKSAHILEQLVVLDDYNIHEIILSLHFLCTDNWWKNLSSALTFKSFRSIDKKKNITLFDKIYASMLRNRDIISLMSKIEKEIKGQDVFSKGKFK